MNFTQQFWDLVSTAQNIVITSHESPDDDSIGSSLSLLQILTQKHPQKSIRVLYSGSSEDRYSYFNLYKKVEFATDMADILPKETDLLICLDGCQFSRFSKKPELLTTASFKTICIDHHSSPSDVFKLSLIEKDATSTAELIYKYISSESDIDKQLAETLMLGIIGDTGYFNYIKSEHLEIFDIAKKLMKIADMELQNFRSKYDTISQRVFEIIKEIISNSQFVTIDGWPSFMTSFVEREALSEFNYTDNEVSSASHIFMSNYFRVITGYPWGVIVTPKANGDCGISTRSLPNNVSVRSILQGMKVGGGHDRAAGGTFKSENGEPLDPKKCLNQVIDWLKKNEVVIS